MKLFFFDTETTGLNPGVDRIIQFGGIFGTLNEKTFEFTENQRINQLINVDIKIPDEVSAVHGIQNQDLEGFGYIDEYIYEFLALIKKADFVIGHNISFDRDMLKGETKLLGIPFDFDKVKWIDTMKPTTELVNGKGGKWPRLTDLHKFLFGCEFDNAHDAMADIEATKNCFIELIKNYDIYKEFIAKKINFRDYIFLKSLTSITDEQAEDLVKMNHGIADLHLEGLTSITDKQAEYLSNFSGSEIYLDGLTSITDKQAEYLSKFKGNEIHLNGLTSITDKQAKYLLVDFCGRPYYSGYLVYYGNVYLDGLTSITDKQAEYFSKLEDVETLSLAIENITDKQAEYLSKFKGNKLFLDGLTNLTDRQIKIISRFFGFSLSLSGLTSITDEQAEDLADSSAEVLYLNGLRSITDEQAKQLSRFCGSELFIVGLESITDNQEKILSKYKGELHLHDD